MSDVETQYRLEEFVQVVLSASGIGSVLNVGPKVAGERWHITLLSANGNFGSRLQVFRGNSFAPTKQIDVTDRADGDTSVCDLELRSGEVISFSWTLGTNAAIMSCRIEGERFVKGRRAY